MTAKDSVMRPAKDVLQVPFRVESIQFGRANEAANCCSHTVPRLSTLSLTSTTVAK